MFKRYWLSYRAIARGGLIGAVIVFGAAATSNPPTPSRRNTQTQSQTATTEHHADSQNAPKNSPEPLIIEIEQPTNQRPIATQTEDQGRWYSTPDWWVAGFTCALFVATSGLWLFTALMWRATRRVAEDSEKAIGAAQRSATAAEDAVTKSDAALEHAQDTAKRELRAYLSVGTVSDTSDAELGVVVEGVIRFALCVKNHGQTPAHKVTCWVGLVVREDPLFVGSLPPINENNRIGGRSTLNPGQESSINGLRGREISNAELQAVRDGRCVIYLYGRIEFTDAFDRSQYVNFRLMKRDLDSESRDLKWHDEGNDAS